MAAEDMINHDTLLVPDDISYPHESDDAEETLSFCDLALNDTSSDWDNASEIEDDGDESSSLDEDFFGFFSEDFTSINAHHAESVIFCGKLIPFKGAERSDSFTRNPRETRNIDIPSETSDSLTSFRAVPSKIHQRKCYKTCETKPVYATRKLCDAWKGVPVKNELMQATPKKSRWYVLTFGAEKEPVKVGLSDIRIRQEKRNLQAKMSESRNRRVVKSYKGRQGTSLWSLLKALSCKNYNATAVATASCGCLPSV